MTFGVAGFFPSRAANVCAGECISEARPDTAGDPGQRGVP